MVVKQELSLAEVAVEQLQSSRRFLQALLDSLAEENLLTHAGGVGNHAIWVMGHMASTDDLFVSAFKGEESWLPTGHAKQFGQSSTPGKNWSDYAPYEEMLEQFVSSREKSLEWIASLEGDLLWQESPEVLKPVAANAIMAAYTISFHEGVHAGQLTTIRASLGMAPLFG